MIFRIPAAGQRYGYSSLRLGENKRSPLLQPYCWPVVEIVAILLACSRDSGHHSSYMNGISY